jgi:hypothetical protein
VIDRYASRNSLRQKTMFSNMTMYHGRRALTDVSTWLATKLTRSSWASSESFCPSQDAGQKATVNIHGNDGSGGADTSRYPECLGSR